jgi:endonuclease YncB( thermonuclease family)
MLVILSLLNLYSYADTDLVFNCSSKQFDEKATIQSVIDGDTVILTDKRHIRLIGINTPELNHDDKKASEVGAEEARISLIDMLENHDNIWLIYGEERLDRHGRTLAHLYLDNGLNVQARMLSQGLAMPLRIPPNIALSDCYSQISMLAKRDHLGLWSLDRYKTHPVSSLTGNERGFYFISGKLEKITESRSSLWLNLHNNVALRIHKDDLNYFNKNDLMSLQGKVIEASGWLYKRNKQLRMRIRHKLDLKALK